MMALYKLLSYRRHACQHQGLGLMSSRIGAHCKISATVIPAFEVSFTSRRQQPTSRLCTCELTATGVSHAMLPEWVHAVNGCMPCAEQSSSVKRVWLCRDLSGRRSLYRWLVSILCDV